MLYQDLALVDCRDILSNLFLGREPRRFGGLFVDSKKMETGSKMMLNGLRINVPSVKTLVDVPLRRTASGSCHRQSDCSRRFDPLSMKPRGSWCPGKSAGAHD